MNRRSRFSRGQMLVMFTIMIPALLAMVGLGCDVAVLYFNWVQLQKAADASALAGASELTGEPDTTDDALVEARATSYAESNGITQSEIVSIAPASDAKSVTVRFKRTVPYFFLRVLGLKQGYVAAKAVAGIQPSTAACGLSPIGLPCSYSALSSGTCGGKYEVGQNLTLKADWQNTTTVPGNWEALAIGGSGGSQFKNNIAYGSPGAPISSCAGQTSESACSRVATETGNLVGPTKQGFADRMNGQAYAPAPTDDSTIDPTNPQVITVPIVDFSSAGKGGKGYPYVLDFITLWVTGVDGNGTISATVIPNVPGCGVATTTTTHSNGPYVAVLCPDSGCPATS